MGQDPEFCKGLKTLRLQLLDYINSLKASLASGSNIEQASVPLQGLPSNPYMRDLDYSSEVANLEESWSYFWHEDFGNFLSQNVEQDETNMYLLGLPQSWS